MIARRGILFERALVLLVQHHQPEVWCGSENRALRPDDNLHVAVGDPLPLLVAIGVAEMAVQHRHTVEPRTKPLQRLWRKADLGHQHDRLPSKCGDLLASLEVDLGFAAARDAVN